MLLTSFQYFYAWHFSDAAKPETPAHLVSFKHFFKYLPIDDPPERSFIKYNWDIHWSYYGYCKYGVRICSKLMQVGFELKFLEFYNEYYLSITCL